ncbi:DUF4912 domain-containing protein [Bacillus sp. MRMR6]|uniref:DUF4912 domain-containing protein n=1 Tax=Bacillus sp. MRMR6 TaxID=1928617 RepID=UPI000952563F|nr:DUF4912 domain-containing protein [Bacillus sp. MRMR6]OLS41684.1 hypothetical protein BTR25_03825 [Bacillus sp. MRMR6]
MIDQIVKLREVGLSFRKIASELNTTVGKVQYRWNKWNNELVQGCVDKQGASNEEDTERTLMANDLKGEMQAKLVSPRKVILFWKISEIPEKIIGVYFNSKMDELVHIVRIYDVTDILFTGSNAHHYYEIAVPYNKGYWFVKGLPANRSYVAELGMKVQRSDFFPVYRSNSFQTPANTIANENGLYDDLIQYQQHEDTALKWIDHVSTYTYYDESSVEQNDE